MEITEANELTPEMWRTMRDRFLGRKMRRKITTCGVLWVLILCLACRCYNYHLLIGIFFVPSPSVANAGPTILYNEIAPFPYP
jgi:hypothetical protein